MEIKCFKEGDEICAELFGELDEYSAEYVRISLDDLLNDVAGAKKLVLDFCDSLDNLPSLIQIFFVFFYLN